MDMASAHCQQRTVFLWRAAFLAAISLHSLPLEGGVELQSTRVHICRLVPPFSALSPLLHR
ncbi:hypothetical protein IT575_07340 [bacterium]|nr:hypothetical protein [bacterium]